MSASGAVPTLQEQLAEAVEALSIPHRFDNDRTLAEAFPVIAVAYSGGLDSSVLLHLAAEFARERGIRLFAFHIHHGISANADQWQTHCRAQSERVGAGFDTRNVTLATKDKSGVEEAARVARYQALGQLCREHGAGLLLTAHHLDDQAETVLLQMLRGSGVAGISGMDGANVAAELLGDANLLMARPLLGASRGELEQYARQEQVAYVEDESNSDTRYARNALRHKVMPVLAEFFPGFQERFARAAGHAQAAQRLLTVLADQDIAACLEGEYLSVPALRRLDSERIDNLLRHWLGLRGLRMPSSAWLFELRTQLLDAKYDAQLCVTHPDCHVRRYRDRVFLTPRRPPFDENTGPQPFTWRGEEKLHFPQFSGSLFFEVSDIGFNAAWLREQALSVCLRSGGERVRLAWNRPAKSLKYHFQNMDIPAWERPYLPLVFAQEQILYAAGIGMDCHAQPKPGEESDERRIALRWQADLS
ncbi:MesJ cell cycle protein [Herbaspirillum hiltneri N3]|uniref:tRNA(Ile)-lysidine synthase n=1 Tax=Herbaspirillum hiltneri N3 TaxID=1262470 RepID=A0ABM5V0X6_9BURK|nr:tRNA lysidine(34) synthetase TilS [Herbaspirillum hiltneri]AKZ63145.1 MesJ cell cycle protein [Herbaspirillum hiltneri N3]